MRTAKSARPRWRSSTEPVRASSRQRCARGAPLVQIFWPVMRQPSPSRTARVRSPARSEPASGSEKPWHQISRISRMAGR